MPLVPEHFGLKPLDEKEAGKQLAVVRHLFRSANELICATDAGREGELIFRYIPELTGYEGTSARRLWLSSLTRETIRDAFGRLRPLSDYDSLYQAARCRSEADWVVGRMQPATTPSVIGTQACSGASAGFRLRCSR